MEQTDLDKFLSAVMAGRVDHVRKYEEDYVFADGTLTRDVQTTISLNVFGTEAWLEFVFDEGGRLTLVQPEQG